MSDLSFGYNVSMSDLQFGHNVSMSELSFVHNVSMSDLRVGHKELGVKESSWVPIQTWLCDLWFSFSTSQSLDFSLVPSEGFW